MLFRRGGKCDTRALWELKIAKKGKHAALGSKPSKKHEKENSTSSKIIT